MGKKTVRAHRHTHTGNGCWKSINGLPPASVHIYFLTYTLQLYTASTSVSGQCAQKSFGAGVCVCVCTCKHVHHRNTVLYILISVVCFIN